MVRAREALESGKLSSAPRSALVPPKLGIPWYVRPTTASPSSSSFTAVVESLFVHFELSDILPRTSKSPGAKR